jgi:small neutral amino acid transporter SnatA (MarC family)
MVGHTVRTMVGYPARRGRSAVDFHSIDGTVVVDTFFLLLIGVGPKIALVPFLDVTRDMDAATRSRVVRKMLTTAGTVAAVLVVFGGLLTRLLHFSRGALGIAGGIILLIIAVTMVLKSAEPDPLHMPAQTRDPMQLAIFPLAVPYLLNPAGIVLLVVLSAETLSLTLGIIFIGLLVLVFALDIVIFAGPIRSARTWTKGGCWSPRRSSGSSYRRWPSNSS